MTSERDVTALLEHAVADLVPAERRPTDAVLARAASRPWARLRKWVAGLLGVALLGGGAVVVATGTDDGRTVDTPRPLRLTVEPPAGWSVVDRPVTADCTTDLAPLTVYRQAAIADLGSCPEGGRVPDGPVLLIGRLDPAVAEEIRSVGSATTAAGLPAYAVAYDAAAAVVTWLPVGDHGNLAYTLVAPHSGEEAPAFADLVGAGTWRAPREALAVAASVTARGQVATEPVLPEQVSAVDLRPTPVNVDAAPGARVLDSSAVGAVVEALRATADGPSCGEPVSARTLHLQDARTGRWARVDVTEDGAGCRTAVSEMGGSARITGDPVAVALSSRSQQTATVASDAEVVTAHGLSVAVPQGWAVVRARAVDPCRLQQASVVVADVLEPSCLLGMGARPAQPYLWLTARPLEDDRFRTASGLRLPPSSREVLTVDGLRVTWTGEGLTVGTSYVEGLLGRPEVGPGRVFVAGLGSAASSDLRATVRAG